MSCPSWTELLQHRFDATLAEPEGLAAARRHLVTCDSCQREVLEIDGSLLFEQLEPVELAEDEAEEMVRAVRTLRRSSVTQLSTPPPPQSGWRRSFVGVAAAALLLLALLPVARELSNDRSLDEPAATSLEPAPVSFSAPFEIPSELPLIEGPLADEARVYRLDGEKVSIVMVVAETLEF